MSEYGLINWVDGKPVLTPDGVGGVYAGSVTFSNTASTYRYTFTELLGRTIFAFVIAGGYHEWVAGVDGNGYPYIEAPGYPIPSWQSWPAGTFNTVVGVFTR